MKTNSKAGFSLVELMVVVAIIGILATIAVPNFQKFQARAKQSNAKTELTGIYTAQKAFFVEYSTYHAHLPAVGFVPEGIDVADGYPVNTDASRIYGSTVHPSGNADELPESSTLGEGGLPPIPRGLDYDGYVASVRQCGRASTLTGIAADGDPEIEQNSFVAVSVGCPGGNVPLAETDPVDVWSINESRALKNEVSGI